MEVYLYAEKGRGTRAKDGGDRAEEGISVGRRGKKKGVDSPLSGGKGWGSFLAAGAGGGEKKKNNPDIRKRKGSASVR